MNKSVKTKTDYFASSEHITSDEVDPDVGQTVGLIDSLIFICRSLAPRLRMVCGDQEAQPIIEALRDLSQDQAVCWVWDHRPHSPDEQTDLKLIERSDLASRRDRSTTEDERLRELHEWAMALTFQPMSMESRFADRIEDLNRRLLRDLVK